MRTKITADRIGVAAVALFSTIGLSPRANAFNFVWVDGPDAGTPYAPTYLGATTWNLTNYDTGTLYNFFPNGTAIGFGQGGSAGSIAAGAAQLDAPVNIFRPVLNGIGSEDGWGLVKISDIEAIDPTDNQVHQIFNSVVSPFEIVGIFHGEKDFYLNQVTDPSGPSSGQIIDGTGLKFDIYSGPKNFSFSGGPSLRIDANHYPTVSDGTLELSLESTPGFIRHAGSMGGVDTEFESNTSLVGYTALNVVGGTSAHTFDSNGIGFGGSYGVGFIPGDVTPAADTFFQYSVSAGVSGWDVTSHDPGTFLTVPEPASAAGLIGCLAPILGMAFRRHRSGKANA